MSYKNDDFEPNVKEVTVKTKKAPRWRRRQQRRLDRKEHLNFCELTNESPEPLTGGQISAAKLKGSTEYIQKLNKMAERRAHVRTHEQAEFTPNVRWCGCSTDVEMEHCVQCAEYGAPDMKPVTENKWGSKYVPTCTPSAKKRKIRPHDKPCKPNWQYLQCWSRPHPESYTIIKNIYIIYETNPFPYE